MYHTSRSNIRKLKDLFDFIFLKLYSQKSETIYHQVNMHILLRICDETRSF